MERLFLSLLLLFAYASAQEGQEKKNLTWDYMIFAQVWPYSLCDVANLLQVRPIFFTSLIMIS